MGNNCKSKICKIVESIVEFNFSTFASQNSEGVINIFWENKLNVFLGTSLNFLKLFLKSNTYEEVLLE